MTAKSDGKGTGRMVSFRISTEEDVALQKALRAASQRAGVAIKLSDFLRAALDEKVEKVLRR